MYCKRKWTLWRLWWSHRLRADPTLTSIRSYPTRCLPAASRRHRATARWSWKCWAVTEETLPTVISSSNRPTWPNQSRTPPCRKWTPFSTVSSRAGARSPASAKRVPSSSASSTKTLAVVSISLITISASGSAGPSKTTPSTSKSSTSPILCNFWTFWTIITHIQSDIHVPFDIVDQQMLCAVQYSTNLPLPDEIRRRERVASHIIAVQKSGEQIDSNEILNWHFLIHSLYNLTDHGRLRHTDLSSLHSAGSSQIFTTRRLLGNYSTAQANDSGQIGASMTTCTISPLFLGFNNI